MINLFKSQDTIDKEQGKKRSPHWEALRKAFLKGKVCALCGGTDKLEAHHMMPFHLHPELELDVNNLIPLCESKKGGVNCHLYIGHLGSFKSYNETVNANAIEWNNKIRNRP